jgi:hypothetical protein
VETYERLKTYKQDSRITLLIITEDNNIIIATEDGKVSVWKVLI